MAIQYKWQFPKLGVTYNQGALTDVVSTVYFYFIAEEDNITVHWPGSINIGSPHQSSFIPYNQVTKEYVEAWTEAAIGADKLQAMKDKLAAELVAKKAPAKGEMNPPWA